MNKKLRIGYACTPLTLPYRTSRSFILKNFSEELFSKCVSENLTDLMNILKWNVQNEIYMFRISSDIIPFASHPVNNIQWWELFKDELAEIGAFIQQHNIRVSMHPGQYTVLNSPNEDVVKRSIDELEYHCKFLDALGVNYSHKIILHVGGVYGDKPSAMTRFIANFYKLSPSMQKRLVIENDDKSYTIENILSICHELHIPAVFDNLHHRLNPCSYRWDEIMTQVKKTWREEDGPVKFHYSDQDPIKKGGAHSKFVVTSNFLEYVNSIQQLDADVMLEVKDKELSALKCIYVLKEQPKVSVRTEQWAKYKYCVMEKSYSHYKKCSALVNSEVPLAQVYNYIEHCLNAPFDEGNFRNTVQHVYGYLKEKVTEKEKEKLFLLMNHEEVNYTKLKDLLQKLCKKYEVNYINDSYYFIY